MRQLTWILISALLMAGCGNGSEATACDEAEQLADHYRSESRTAKAEYEEAVEAIPERMQPITEGEWEGFADVNPDFGPAAARADELRNEWADAYESLAVLVVEEAPDCFPLDQRVELRKWLDERRS